MRHNSYTGEDRDSTSKNQMTREVSEIKHTYMNERTLIISSTHSHSIKVCSALLVLLVIFAIPWSLFVLANATHSGNPLDAGLDLTIDPSSVVMKVGEKARINVTVTTPEALGTGQICFEVQGFPESGFRTSFLPECAAPQLGAIRTVLTVEVTPAAAPQNVTAFVIVRSSTQIAQATLLVTVEPAMPAWVPWLGLLLFFSILGIAIAWTPRSTKKSARRRRRKQRKGGLFFDGAVGSTYSSSTSVALERLQ